MPEVSIKGHIQIPMEVMQRFAVSLIGAPVLGEDKEPVGEVVAAEVRNGRVHAQIRMLNGAIAEAKVL